MSKRKKKPVAEVPAPRRGYPMPKNLIWKIAKSIVANRADEEAIYNTLKDFYTDSYTKGYFRRIDDSNRFKMAREGTIKEIFDAVKDRMDDHINCKVTNQSK